MSQDLYHYNPREWNLKPQRIPSFKLKICSHLGETKSYQSSSCKNIDQSLCYWPSWPGVTGDKNTPSQTLLHSSNASFFLGRDLKTTLFMLEALIKKSNLTHSNLPEQHFITFQELKTISVVKHYSAPLPPWVLLGGLAYHFSNLAHGDWAINGQTDLKTLQK